MKARRWLRTLPVYLNSLAGRGVHVVTVNDYLAKARRGVDGKSCYSFLGLTVGVIVHDLDDEQRKAAYRSDHYVRKPTTNSAFDYLRDNMKFDMKRLRAAWTQTSASSMKSTRS